MVTKFVEADVLDGGIALQYTYNAPNKIFLLIYIKHSANLLVFSAA